MAWYFQINSGAHCIKKPYFIYGFGFCAVKNNTVVIPTIGLAWQKYNSTIQWDPMAMIENCVIHYSSKP